MANLRELASFYRQIQAQIEDNHGEVTDDVLDELTRYEDDIDTKVDAISVLMTDAEMWADRHKADAAESTQMEKVKRAELERLKEWVRVNLELAGLEKAGRKYPWRYRLNSVPKFTWEKEGEPIPEGFQIVKPALVTLDTKKCAKLFREGDNSAVFLPDGISYARGTHVQPAYRKGRKLVEQNEGDDDGTE